MRNLVSPLLTVVNCISVTKVTIQIIEYSLLSNSTPPACTFPRGFAIAIVAIALCHGAPRPSRLGRHYRLDSCILKCRHELHSIESQINEKDSEAVKQFYVTANALKRPHGCSHNSLNGSYCPRSRCRRRPAPSAPYIQQARETGQVWLQIDKWKTGDLGTRCMPCLPIVLGSSAYTCVRRNKRHRRQPVSFVVAC